MTHVQRYEEAELSLLQGFELLSGAHGTEHQTTQQAAAALAGLYEEWGEPQQAEDWHDRAGQPAD